MVRRALKLNDQIKQLAAELKDEQSCLMFGRGRNYATAMEAALKVRCAAWLGDVNGWDGASAAVRKQRRRAAVEACSAACMASSRTDCVCRPHPCPPPPQVKEVSYMHSEGINAGEMKHGPLALVDDKLPILVVSTMDTMHSKMAGVIQQVRRRAGWLARGSAEGWRVVPRWRLRCAVQLGHAWRHASRGAFWPSLCRRPLGPFCSPAAHGAQRPPDCAGQRGGRRDGGHRQRCGQRGGGAGAAAAAHALVRCWYSEGSAGWLCLARLLAPAAAVFTALPPALPPARPCADKYPIIQVPRVDDALQAVVNIIPLQLLSYHLTTLRGYNGVRVEEAWLCSCVAVLLVLSAGLPCSGLHSPTAALLPLPPAVDQPRNLAKSVTVTEASCFFLLRAAVSACSTTLQLRATPFLPPKV